MKVINSSALSRPWPRGSVVTIGKYDGMHLGHQRILEMLKDAARRRDLPSVVVLSEPQPEEFFSGAEAPPRLSHFDDKVAWLEEFGIDAVVRLHFDRERSEQPAGDFVDGFLVQQLAVQCLVVGDDFRFGARRGGDLALLQRMGRELGFAVQGVGACTDAGERVSSTLVRQSLLAGDCQRAERLLGRPYSISGVVVEGRQLGRQIGIPTANLALQTRGLPMTGVFAVRVSVSGSEYNGVANLGFKPTVSSELVASLEVHLLDFDRDLYGQRLRVHFISKLRNERRFSGIDALLQQIRLDVAAARALLATPGVEIVAP
jgi:riboflavin kinase/FMN adenylyltransferase